MHVAAHEGVADAAELGAQHLERAGAGRGEPEVGDHARHHVHLGAELRHVEIVQHVDRAQQHLDRPVDRQVQVARPRRSRRRRRSDRPGSTPSGLSGPISRASERPSRPSAPGSRKLHCHCCATTSTSVASSGTVTKLAQTKRPGRQHRRDADRGDDGQPELEPPVLGLVVGAGALAMAEAEDAVGHEQHDRREDEPGDPEGDRDRVVDVAPVRGDRRPPPRAQQVKQHRADDDDDECERDGHALRPSGSGRLGEPSAGTIAQSAVETRMPNRRVTSRTSRVGPAQLVSDERRIFCYRDVLTRLRPARASSEGTSGGET